LSNAKSQRTNLAWLLWCEAELRGDSPAIIARDDRATYHDLRGRAAAFANTLARAGVDRGERVAIFLEPGIDCAAAYFGVAAAGAVAIVVNEAVRPRQFEHMVRHANARVLLTTSDMLRRLGRPLLIDAVVIDVSTVPDSATWLPVDCDADQPVQVIYTSGSTGLPKGVVHAHGNLRRGIEICVDYLGLTPSDRVAALLPFSSIYGLNQLLSSIAAGATLIVARFPVAAQSMKMLREEGATVLAAVPPLWTQLLTTPAFQQPLLTLRQMQNAGGHLPRETIRRLRMAQPQAKLILQYGMTEVVRSTFLPADEVDRRPDSIGRAMPNTEILVLRDDLTPAAPGELGELVHRGPTVALGYLNDPEATARTFRPYPFGDPNATERVVFSGDMVRRDEDGYLYFVSRRDRMIKSLGFRVGPDEVVDSLHASGEVHEAQVTTMPDSQRGEAIVAHVVLRPGGDLERLEKFCRAELPRWMQPSRFVVHERMPRMPNGKHDLETLREIVMGEAPGVAYPTTTGVGELTSPLTEARQHARS
jgi:acyl-CoA synthetase (AMP-forming)/AMP-acid ligase II